MQRKIQPRNNKDKHISKLANKAIHQFQGKKFAQSVSSYRKLIQLVPPNAQIFQNLAVALISCGNISQALEALTRALEIDPNCVEAYSNIGALLHERGESKKALEFLQRAIELAPQFADAHSNLGSALSATGQLEKAINAYQHSLTLDGSLNNSRYELCGLRRQACDWPGLEAQEEQCIQVLRQDNFRVSPYSIMAMKHLPATLLEFNKRFALGLVPDQSQIFQHSHHRRLNQKSENRLRIGYLSSDLRQHAVGSHMVELFEKHDQTKFELFAYCYGKDDKSEMRTRIVSAFDHFSSINTYTDHDAAQQIFDDKIDVLVDLNGYTGPTRSKILAYRPAPCQVGFLGYPATMGADFVDYFIADKFVVPEHHLEHFAESIVYMPDTYQPNDSQKKIATQAPTRSQYGLPEKGFVFCSFNNTFKFTHEMFSVWMRLLKQVPDSALWLLETNALCKANLQRQALEQGVDPNRIVFAPKIPLEEHLARHKLADLFLDCVPINAHATAADALWVGLPVLTSIGPSFVGRVASSLLNAVGLPELVTTTLDGYEKLAVQLATDQSILGDIKHRLEQNRSTSPLFDTEKYTKNIEKAFAHMAHLHAHQQKPTTFAVSQLTEDDLTYVQNHP